MLGFNPFLWRPVIFFQKSADIIVSVAKVFSGDPSGLISKITHDPSSILNLPNDWIGAKEDMAVMKDTYVKNWQTNNPDKMIQIIDEETGRPVQFDPEQRLSDDGEYFTFDEETGIPIYHAIQDGLVEEETNDLAVEEEYVEGEIEQLKMNLDLETLSEESVQESEEKVISGGNVQSKCVEAEAVQQEMELEYGYDHGLN